MGLQIFSATYQLNKADWWPLMHFPPDTNYQRWVTAHATTYGDLPAAASYFNKSFSFLIDFSGTYYPPNDDGFRQDAHDATPGTNPSTGEDFLYKGNYVHPDIYVNDINGIPVPNGKLYYAGDPSSFDPNIGVINRNYLEVISTGDLDALVPLVDNNSYTIQFNDGAVLITYGENFDGLANTGGPFAWTDNTTLPGWYAYFTNLGTPTDYFVDDGSSNVGGLYSYGTTFAFERALGALGDLTVGAVMFGYKFTNISGNTINAVRVQYTGEQWRSGGVTNNTLVFEYAINPIDINNGTYTSVSNLNFVSPNLSNVGAVDGNNAANQQVFDYTFAATANPGDSIWLRWSNGGNDHGLAIDNLTITGYS